MFSSVANLKMLMIYVVLFLLHLLMDKTVRQTEDFLNLKKKNLK